MENGNIHWDDAAGQFRDNLNRFGGFEPNGNTASGARPHHVRDPEFHLKAHFHLDENASAQDWLDWASAVG
ncbi:MAG: hypothetical protein AB1758_32700 [Candidatus Eremiobacterota bacterium]